jgi:hypothetical protein
MGVLKDIDLCFNQVNEPMQTRLRQEFARWIAQTGVLNASLSRGQPNVLSASSNFEQQTPSPAPQQHPADPT